MNDRMKSAFSRIVTLKNVTCPFCGIRFSENRRPEKEHTIGRRFVPKGVLDGQWNLLIRSCHDCNTNKSELECDISAITMQPDLFGRYAADDDRLKEEASRKAKGSISKRTKKAVACGEEPIQVSQDFGGLSFSITFVVPPQVDEDRIFRLSRYHISAFFHWITYNQKTREGALLPGRFAGLVVAKKQDWGHPYISWFSEYTSNWLGRVHGISAQGYFKVWIKRKSLEEDIWAWALEWNRNMRVVGFFGDNSAINDLADLLPELPMKILPIQNNVPGRYRIEVPLPEDQDRLFDPPEDLQY